MAALFQRVRSTGEAHSASLFCHLWVGETFNSSVSGYGEKRNPKAANKACKRNRDRIVPLIPRLQQQLLDRIPKNWQTEPKNDPIFYRLNFLQCRKRSSKEVRSTARISAIPTLI